MRLLIEVEIQEGTKTRQVMEEIDSSIDGLNMGENVLRLGESGTISHSTYKIFGNWKVVRP